MYYAMNWIQEGDFNLLHNMRGAKFSLLDSMRGAKCTICKAESLSICRKSIVLQGKINLPGRCLLSMQTTGCMAEYFTTAGYFYKTSTSTIEIISRQPNTVDLFRTGTSVHGNAEQEVVSHPFPSALPLVCAAASVLPFNQCQCASL